MSKTVVLSWMTMNMDLKSNEKKEATLNRNRYFQNNYAKIDTLL